MTLPHRDAIAADAAGVHFACTGHTYRCENASMRWHGWEGCPLRRAFERIRPWPDSPPFGTVLMVAEVLGWPENTVIEFTRAWDNGAPVEAALAAAEEVATAARPGAPNS